MDPKLAVITGASGGIGYELAIQFAKNGYDLVLIARRQKILEQFAH
ncbi:SDR family NAD(P)-dependent oxidoreductase, partial [bacterium]|nr:SDR family NAD(P)-dependent oxidoreductase [bacterium]